jgi:hypothetical protein
LKDRPRPREVKLPDPWDPDKGMKSVIVFCRAGRVHPYTNIDPMLDKYFDTIRKVTNQKGKNLQLNQGDIGRIQDHFRDNDVGDEWFRLAVQLRNTGLPGNVSLDPEFRPRKADGQGETADEARHPDSMFSTAVKAIDPRKQYVIFMVWDDTFEPFIDCRAMVEEAGVRTGWEPYGREETFSVPLGGKGGGAID